MKHNYQFTAVPNQVITVLANKRNKDLFVIYTLLLNLSEDDKVQISEKTLSDITGWEEKNISRKINSLIDMGLISKRTLFDKANIYYINIEDDIQKVAENNTLPIEEGLSKTTPQKGVKNNTSEGCQKQHPNKDITKNIKNNNTNLVLESKSNSTSQDEVITIKKKYRENYITTAKYYFDNSNWNDFQNWTSTWYNNFFNELSEVGYFADDNIVEQFNIGIDKFHSEQFNIWQKAISA